MLDTRGVNRPSEVYLGLYKCPSSWTGLMRKARKAACRRRAGDSHLLAFPVQRLGPAIDLQPPLPRRLGGAVAAAAAAVARALQLLVIEIMLLLPAAGLLLAGVAGRLPPGAGGRLRLLERWQRRPGSLTGSPRIGALHGEAPLTLYRS